MIWFPIPGGSSLKMFRLADNITDLGSTRSPLGKSNMYAENQHLGSISIKRHFLRGLLFASSFCYYLNTDIDGVATSIVYCLEKKLRALEQTKCYLLMI